MVHVIDEESGREQMLALTESEVPPRTETEHWTLEDARRGLKLQPFSAVEAMNQRDERLQAAQAKAPTVAAPPGYSSGSSEVPKASAPHEVPKASAPGELPKASAPHAVPKASAPKAKAKAPSSSQVPKAATPKARHRANYAEQVEVSCVATARVDLGPQVLVDSGANEVIRPRPEKYDVHRCKKTQAALASGDTVNAWRTRDGELMIDWILSVRRLRGIQGAFVWDELGPRVKYWNGEYHITVQCMEQNGLPYISWEDFKPIRMLLAKDWRKRGNISIMHAETSPLHVTDYEPTIEILGSRFQEECKIAPVVALEDAGEQRAKELCAKSKITFDEVWDAIQQASLVERRTEKRESS